MLSDSLACVECESALQRRTGRGEPHAKTATVKDSKHIMLAAGNELREDRSNESSEHRAGKIESMTACYQLGISCLRKHLRIRGTMFQRYVLSHGNSSPLGHCVHRYVNDLMNHVTRSTVWSLGDAFGCVCAIPTHQWCSHQPTIESRILPTCGQTRQRIIDTPTRDHA